MQGFLQSLHTFQMDKHCRSSLHSRYEHSFLDERKGLINIGRAKGSENWWVQNGFIVQAVVIIKFHKKIPELFRATTKEV